MPRQKAKTVETKNSVLAFIKAIPDQQKQQDAMALIEIMKKQSCLEPKMWGPSIVGFGSYHYKYATGHEGDAPLVGFSPRKAAFSLYISCNLDTNDELLKKFGKYKASKGCIYFKKMADINTEVLKKMITNTLRDTKAKYY